MKIKNEKEITKDHNEVFIHYLNKVNCLICSLMKTEMRKYILFVLIMFIILRVIACD